MKKLLLILIAFVFIGCHAADDDFTVGELVSVTNLNQSCNCVVEHARNDDYYVNLLCEDENGKYSLLENVSAELIATCDGKK